ncbi:MAG: hypothetical protein OHK0028_10110 [Deltaproteobacteria bacterium]
MNGPLLATLLPPESAFETMGSVPETAPIIAFLLLTGFFLSLFLHHPRR